MVRCPACDSVQIVFIAGPRRTTCYECSTTWIQRGGEQTAVQDAGSATDKAVGADSGVEPSRVRADVIDRLV